MSMITVIILKFDVDTDRYLVGRGGINDTTWHIPGEFLWEKLGRRPQIREWIEYDSFPGVFKGYRTGPPERRPEGYGDAW
jgi:hypothetical protein